MYSVREYVIDNNGNPGPLQRAHPVGLICGASRGSTLNKRLPVSSKMRHAHLDLSAGHIKSNKNRRSFSGTIIFLRYHQFAQEPNHAFFSCNPITLFFLYQRSLFCFSASTGMHAVWVLLPLFFRTSAVCRVYIPYCVLKTWTFIFFSCTLTLQPLYTEIRRVACLGNCFVRYCSLTIAWWTHCAFITGGVARSVELEPKGMQVD